MILSNDGTLCLVPKINEETEFIAALGEMLKVANGSLGWKGHAEMLLDIDKNGEVFKALQIGPPTGTREEQTAQLIEWLQESFWQSVVCHAEWIPKEEGEARWKSLRILYGTTD